MAFVKRNIAIGRIVRYRTTESERVILGAYELPAIIVGKGDGSQVNLRIMPNNQVDEKWKANVPHGQQLAQWSWPEEYSEWGGLRIG